MRAFVTGGTGFLGRRLVETLRERGDPVAALARSTPSARAVERAGATPVRGDLGDADAMAEGMADCDVVFHLAAKVEEWGDPAAFERVNVRGTANALAAARRAGVDRFVHASTEAVLAGRNGHLHIRPSARPERWTRPCGPTSTPPRWGTSRSRRSASTSSGPSRSR